MTDQREQALAAVNRLESPTEGTDENDYQADLDIIRVALTSPPLPADLAEAYAALGRLLGDPDDGMDYDSEYAAMESDASRVAKALAELAELRARPTLTAVQARTLLALLERYRVAEIKATLRAIAEGAGS